jgi:hypothetical protein
MNSVNFCNNSQPSLDDTVISILDNPTIPALWNSKDDGEAWECGDYLAILQTNPITIAEGMSEVSEFRATFKDVAKKCKNEFRNLYSMTVYYKTGKNPSGKDSSRPSMIITLEQTKQFGSWGTIFVEKYVPSVRLNLGVYEGELSSHAARSLFLQSLFGKEAETARKIGTIADAYKLKTGKTLNKKPSGSGCLGIIVLLVLFPIFLIKTIWMSA